MSLRLRLALWVGAVSLGTQVLVLLVSLYTVRAVAIQSAQDEMVRLVRSGPESLRRNLSLFHSEEAFLLSPTGEILDPPGAAYLPALRRALDQGLVVPGHEGLVVMSDGSRTWFALHRVGPGGDTIGLVETEARATSQLDVVREEILAAGAAGSLILLLLVWLITRGITEPLVGLAAATRQLAQGDLDAPVPPVEQQDEVFELATSFAQMQKDLKDHIRRLEVATAKNERMESEFTIGSQIQRTFLPSIAEGRDLALMDGRASLAAAFRPARRVSGDLYDILPLSPTRLVLAIGDVAGKGLPAALLMVVTHTLLRAAAAQSMDPAACLARVNRLVCDENRAALFVTLQLLYVDLEEGTLTWANAGHPPPILIGSDGSSRFLVPPEGLVLGVEEDASYEASCVPIEVGQTLVLYTDGISEATDAEDRMFGEDRLALAASELAGRPVDGMLGGILEAMEAFAQGRAPKDDLTLVVFRRRS